jgi:hypothetical protein
VAPLRIRSTGTTGNSLWMTNAASTAGLSTPMSCTIYAITASNPSLICAAVWQSIPKNTDWWSSNVLRATLGKIIQGVLEALVCAESGKPAESSNYPAKPCRQPKSEQYAQRSGRQERAFRNYASGKDCDDGEPSDRSAHTKVVGHPQFVERNQKERCRGNKDDRPVLFVDEKQNGRR